jgi:hypothetical protein
VNIDSQSLGGSLPLKLCSVFTTFCEFVAGEQRHLWNHIDGHEFAWLIS